MKRILSLFLTAALLLSVSACASKDQSEEPVEVICYAAASMTETLTQIKVLYEKEHSGVTITFNFDSSGTLKTQIQEGASCDLFISAGQKQMDELDIVDSGSRINLLENKVALVVLEGNPKGINSFQQLAERLPTGELLFAMGNSDVPVGQYTQKIFSYYGLNKDELTQAGAITYGSNVKEVTTQVSEASVDCGVVYCTDAFSAGLTVVDSATAEMCGQIIYPAAVLKTAQQPEAAQDFLDFLTTQPAMELFEAVGFSPAA